MESTTDRIRVDLLTREYPPKIYGGAGVHVAELAAVLRPLVRLKVRCFDGTRAERDVSGYEVPQPLRAANPALGTLGVNLEMVADCAGADLVHSHTWYANLAGHLAHLLYGIPHVVTAHSLEPLRPWKAEQLGGGYAVSSWAERSAYLAADAVIAVSAGMRADILRCYPQIDPERVHVVHNGIDSHVWRRPSQEQIDAAASTYGIDRERPVVVFVGRITRQKGLPYLLRAASQLPKDVQLVLCAGAPDTPQLAAEVTQAVHRLKGERGGVVWIADMLPKAELMAVISTGWVFVCPSVYEPLGIVNLEAMACGVPVVGTATGGIPEVVVDGQTGWLVPIQQAEDGSGTPLAPETFVANLAAALAEAVSDPNRAREMGQAARARAVEQFSWHAIARQTLDVYRQVRA